MIINIIINIITMCYKGILFLLAVVVNVFAYFFFSYILCFCMSKHSFIYSRVITTGKKQILYVHQWSLVSVEANDARNVQFMKEQNKF